MGGVALAWLVGLAAAWQGGAVPCTWFLEGDDLFGPVQEVVLTRTEGNETRTILLRYDRDGFPVARLAKPPNWMPFGPEKFVFGFSSDLLPQYFQVVEVERTGPFTWVLRPGTVPPEYEPPSLPGGSLRRPPPGLQLGGFLPGEALPPGSKVVRVKEGPPPDLRVVLEWEPEARRLTMARYDMSLLHTYQFFFDPQCRLSLVRHLDAHGELKWVVWRFYEGGCLLREFVWEVRPDVRHPAQQLWWGGYLVRSWVYLPGGLNSLEIATIPGVPRKDLSVAIEELAFDHYGNWTHRRLRSREWAGFCLVGLPPCDREVVETRVITYYPGDTRQ